MKPNLIDSIGYLTEDEITQRRWEEIQENKYIRDLEREFSKTQRNEKLIAAILIFTGVAIGILAVMVTLL